MRTRKKLQEVGFDLSDSLGFLVSQVSKRMTAQFNAELVTRDLTVAQWSVLACLWADDGLAQREISARSGIDAATLTEMLKRMAAHGLISRERDPANNRIQRVYLTTRDTALRDEIAGFAARVNRRAVRGLSATERTDLLSLLRRVQTNLEGDPS